MQYLGSWEVVELLEGSRGRRFLSDVSHSWGFSHPSFQGDIDEVLLIVALPSPTPPHNPNAECMRKRLSHQNDTIDTISVTSPP